MVHRIQVWTVTSFLLILLTSAAWAAPSANSLVKDSLIAPQHWDYSGTQVIISWNVSEKSTSNTLRVFHRKNGGNLVIYPGLNHRAVLDDGRQILQYEPRKNLLLVDKRPPVLNLDSEYRLMARNHRMIPGGTDRICGRTAYVISIVPKAPGNPWRKCWIDSYTHITLKTEQYGPEWPKGEPLNFRFWSSISINPISKKAVQLPIKGIPRKVQIPKRPSVQTIKGLQRILHFKPLLPTDPLAGYVFDGGDTLLMGNAKVLHLRFTNGLNAVSLFESASPFRVRSLAEGDAEVLVWYEDGIHFALVGSVKKANLHTLRHRINRESETRQIREIVALTKNNPSLIMRLHEKGYGLRDIALAILAAQPRRKDPSILLRLYAKGYSWEDLSSRYHFPLAGLRNKISHIPN